VKLEVGHCDGCEDIFWYVMPCNLVGSTDVFEETATITFRGRPSASFCQVTHRRVLVDSMFTKIKTKKKNPILSAEEGQVKE
jgi:hypothetical protein